MCLLHEKPRDKLSRKTFSILADWAQNKATLPTTKFEACSPCKNNTKKTSITKPEMIAKSSSIGCFPTHASRIVKPTLIATGLSLIAWIPYIS